MGASNTLVVSAQPGADWVEAIKSRGSACSRISGVSMYHINRMDDRDSAKVTLSPDFLR